MSCTCTGNSLSINRCANPLLAGSALRIDSTFCHFDSPPHRLSPHPAPKCRTAPRIAATRKHSALHRVHQPLLPSAPRRGHLRDPAPRPKSPHKKKPHRAPDVHIVVRTLRSPETGSFPHSPLEDRSATIRRPPHRHKKRPHNVRAPCPMLREKAERRRENYFAIPFMIAPETPGAAWYSPNE